MFDTGTLSAHKKYFQLYVTSSCFPN